MICSRTSRGTLSAIEESVRVERDGGRGTIDERGGEGGEGREELISRRCFDTVERLFGGC